MQYHPDIVIADRFGSVVAMIEVKDLNGVGVQTATRYLRNLLTHGVVPHARYALLITPDTGYLWSTPDAVLREEAPSLSFPMHSIVQYYLPADVDPTPVSDLVLEPIVEQWLMDLADGIVVDDRVTRGLREAGFLQAVRDGLV
ncbi:MAG: hypothetical protein ACYDCQ_16785, partial [Dehalococcoidia bacterium]